LGIDPRVQKQAAKQEAERNALTFEVLANEWLDNRELEAKDTKEDRRRLAADVIPKIGRMSVVSLDTIRLEELVINPMIKKGILPSATSVRRCLRGIFAIAKRRKIISENPAQDITVPTPVKGNHAAITEPKEVIPMLRAMWAYCERGTPTVSNALIMSASIFLRPAELRKLKWENIHDDENLIIIEPVKQKNKDNKRTLLIPISKQVGAILVDQRRFAGSSPYIFPAQQHGRKDPFISSGTVRNAIINIGYGGLQTPHGFRATAATILGERLNMDKNLIEMQLAHISKDSNGDAYHRGKWLDDRRDMMQAWSDCLDDMRNGKLLTFSSSVD
jgi:integrase